jgi:sec-independent protein translocase protein TatB
VILDVAPTELLVLGVVALLVIPPKDLPKAMRIAGQWMSRARGMARQFRSGFDDMVRESEFAEMEKIWKAENERIMREFPQDQSALMAPQPRIDGLGDLPPVDPPPMTVADPDPQPIATRKPRAKAKPKARPEPKNAGIEQL